MSVMDGAAGLKSALKDLEVAWQRSKDGWNDQVRHQFEKNHIEPLVAQVRVTLSGISRLAEVLARLQRDCS